MVQIIEGPPSRTGMIGEILGSALGSGLGNLYGTYAANKSLEKVLNDKSLESATPMQRMTALQRALGPHGKRGQSLLAQRLQMEMAANKAEEATQVKKQSQAERSALSKHLRGEDLTPQEWGSLSPKSLLELNKQKEPSRIPGDQFSAGYKALLAGDDDAFMRVIADPSTPLSVKKQLTGLREKESVRKSVGDRELRARQSLIRNSYKQAIEAERKKISKDIYPRQDPNEVAKINSRIKKLELLQNVDLKELTKSPDAYTKLHLWNNLDPEFLPEEEDEFEGEELLASGEQQETNDPEVAERITFLNESFPPSGFKGKRKKDKSGRIYFSDGITWSLEQ